MKYAFNIKTFIFLITLSTILDSGRAKANVSLLCEFDKFIVDDVKSMVSVKNVKNLVPRIQKHFFSEGIVRYSSQKYNLKTKSFFEYNKITWKYSQIIKTPTSLISGKIL